MVCTDPELEVHLESDTEPHAPSKSWSGGGLPSAMDTFWLYDRDRDGGEVVTSPEHGVPART